MAEPVPDDDGVIIDHDPSEHPNILTNKSNDGIIWNAFGYLWKMMEGNGYVIVIGAIITYYLYQRTVTYLESKSASSGSGGVESRLSPEEQMNRMEAMRRARERLQAQVDTAAQEESAKQRERDEQQRQEKIEDWERHKRGLGYKSKSSTAAATTAKKPATLKRDSFNPLAGHGAGGSGSYRPSRPSMSRGGG